MMSKIQTKEYKEAEAELKRVGDWIRWAASGFARNGLYFGHGTDNAWDEAVQLVLQILHLPVASDPLVFYSKVTSHERQALREAIHERIEKRKPLPYITQQAWCMGLPIYVDERVLIPRSPMVEWITKEFQPWIQPEDVRSILDIGTGSGCLAIASAVAFPEAHVDAVDLDPAALEVAKINVARHHLEGQIELIQGNCFQTIPADRRYDIILSNPPYVSHEEMATLPPEYLHEPKSALEAEDHGLQIVLQILAAARNYLQPQGVLVVEVGNSDLALMERLPEVPFVWLEQEHGGHGLLLLTKKQLDEAVI